MGTDDPTTGHDVIDHDFAGPPGARFCMACGLPRVEHDIAGGTEFASSSAEPSSGPCTSCDCERFSGPAGSPFCMACGHAQSVHAGCSSDRPDEREVRAAPAGGTAASAAADRAAVRTWRRLLLAGILVLLLALIAALALQWRAERRADLVRASEQEVREASAALAAERERGADLGASEARLARAIADLEKELARLDGTGSGSVSSARAQHVARKQRLEALNAELAGAERVEEQARSVTNGW